MDQQTKPFYEFLGFQLNVGQRVLARDGNPTALTPKAFDILLFLIQNRGRVLEKDELMKAIWPESFVDATSRHMRSIAPQPVFWSFPARNETKGTEIKI